ncbi:hypothetical protein V6Z12_D09G107300 [Gossypium hirsutum]
MPDLARSCWTLGDKTRCEQQSCLQRILFPLS